VEDVQIAACSVITDGRATMEQDDITMVKICDIIFFAFPFDVPDLNIYLVNVINEGENVHRSSGLYLFAQILISNFFS